MFRQLGAAFGVAILTAVFAGVGNFTSLQAFSKGFVLVMSIAALLSFLGAIAGMIQPGRRNVVSVQTQANGSESRRNDAGSTLKHSLGQ